MYFLSYTPYTGWSEPVTSTNDNDMVATLAPIPSANALLQPRSEGRRDASTSSFHGAHPWFFFQVRPRRRISTCRLHHLACHLNLEFAQTGVSDAPNNAIQSNNLFLVMILLQTTVRLE